MKAKIIFLFSIILFLAIGSWGYRNLFHTENVDNSDNNNPSVSEDASWQSKNIGSKEKNNAFRNKDNKSLAGTELNSNQPSSAVSTAKKSLKDLKNDLLSSNTGGKGESPYYKLAVEGVRLISEGNVEKGIEQLNSVLQKDPSNEIALEGLGLYFLEEGHNLEKAQLYFQKLVDINPNNPIAVNEMVYALEEVGGIERVENYLHDLNDKNPNSPVISAALAHALTRQGRIDEAINYMDNAAKSSMAKGDTTNAIALYEEEANAHLDRDNPEEAARLFRLTLKHREQRYQDIQAKGEERKGALAEAKDELVDNMQNLAQTLLAPNANGTRNTSNCEEVQTLLRKLEAAGIQRSDPGFQAASKTYIEQCRP